MFWIIGGDELVRGVGKWCGHAGPATRFGEQLEHVEWEGFRFYDLIFPLFLFLVGTVLPFSLGEVPDGRARQAASSAGSPGGRSLLFAARAASTTACSSSTWPNLRVAGRAPADRHLLRDRGGDLPVHARRGRRRSRSRRSCSVTGRSWPTSPRPDGQAGDFSTRGTWPAGSTATTCPARSRGLLRLRRQRGPALDDPRRGDRPARASWPASGSVGVRPVAEGASAWRGGRRLRWSLGTSGGLGFPIIKNLWTSSYVLVAGGWSLLLLAPLLRVIDVSGSAAWAFFFVVIGVNAITIYVASRFIDFDAHGSKFFLGGADRLSGPSGPGDPRRRRARIEWLLAPVPVSQTSCS